MEKHVLSVLVRDSFGALTRVAGLFARRGFNIDSLIGSRTEEPGVSRMTIALIGDDDILKQFINQLNKLEEVITVLELESDESVFRELALIKVSADSKKRTEISEIVKIFKGKILDISTTTVTIELVGGDGKINSLVNLLKQYGIKELVRTGILGLERGQKDIKSYVEAI